jgi:predicted ArsR family transcriptional regulator
MLLRMAAATGAGASDALDAGREQGRTDARALTGRSCLAAVEARMAELGFDPAVATEEQVATVAFAHCPFRDLAEERPDLICNLHRGLVEGLVAGVGGASVEAFGTLVDRAPCQVDLRLDDDAEEPVPVAGR